MAVLARLVVLAHYLEGLGKLFLFTTKLLALPTHTMSSITFSNEKKQRCISPVLQCPCPRSSETAVTRNVNFHGQKVGRTDMVNTNTIRMNIFGLKVVSVNERCLRNLNQAQPLSIESDV